MGKRVRLIKVGDEQHAVLREIVGEQPTAALAEVAVELGRRTRIRAHAVTIGSPGRNQHGV